MNREEVKALIEEWLRSPPGSRPLLEKAIAEQYRKALTCQWEGLKRDNLTQWLREGMSKMRLLTDSEQDDLDNNVAAILDGAEISIHDRSSALPLAAFKPSDSQKQLYGANALPSDEEIAARVRRILDSI